jgi:O-antigen/teichoic acid export membrane protein/GT2 family glycosyltransferase
MEEHEGLTRLPDHHRGARRELFTEVSSPGSSPPLLPPLTLCIVNWNGERYLAGTLRAAIDCGTPFDEVILIDNASSDASLEIAQHSFPAARVIRLDENRGPGVARNAGFLAARNDRILFIDNDVRLQRGCAERLDAALSDRPDAVFAMPAVLHEKSPETVQFAGASSHFLGMQTLESAETPLPALGPDTREAGSLITACFLADRRRWRGDHLFDESFFMYFEDHELGLRARLLGHRILSVPAARCLHAEGTVGLSRRETGKHTPARVEHTIRNRWQVLVKLYQLRTLAVLAPALLLFEGLQLAGAVKKGWVRPWWRAAAWTGRCLGGILRRRRAFRRDRRLHDADVLRGGPIPFTPGVSRGFLERIAGRLLGAVASANWRLAEILLPRTRRPEEERERKKARGDLALSFASQLVYKILGFAVLALLARGLSREEFGIFAYAAALAGICVLFTELGSSSWLTREAAMRRDEAADRLGEVLAGRIPLLALYALALNVVVAVFQPGLAPAMLLTSIYVGLKDLYRSYSSLFFGLRKLGWTVCVFGGGLILLVVSLAVATAAGGGLVAVLACHVFWAASLAAAGAALSRLAVGKARLRWSPRAALELARRSLPLFLLAALTQVQLGMPTVLLGMLRPYGEVAVYEAGGKLLEASQFMIRPLSLVFLPVCVELAGAGRWGALRSMLGSLVVWAALLGCAVAIAVIAVAGLAVPIVFGAAYAETVPLVRILFLGVPALYANAVAVAFTVSLHRERDATGILLAGTAASLALQVLLISSRGAAGAAWATVLTQAVLAVLLGRFAAGAIHRREREVLAERPAPGLATAAVGPGGAGD